MVGYHARFSYASKLFDYMLCGKPILALTEESELTARVVKDLGGSVAHPENRAEIREALQAMLQQGVPNYQPVDITVEPWARFDRETLTRRFAEVLNQATDKPSGSVNCPNHQALSNAAR
jgi:hypothetical protein